MDGGEWDNEFEGQFGWRINELKMKGLYFVLVISSLLFQIEVVKAQTLTPPISPPRSGHQLLQRPSPQKQFPSNDDSIDNDPGCPGNGFSVFRPRAVESGTVAAHPRQVGCFDV
ncbi:MAG: hypothetical protein NTV46_05240 [Verrucomicrobia bacterium]|nr:hypothetical protein [Verrucomicrobiota bacterium]